MGPRDGLVSNDKDPCEVFEDSVVSGPSMVSCPNLMTKGGAKGKEVFVAQSEAYSEPVGSKSLRGKEE